MIGSDAPVAVLDASALLALLFDESGADRVERAIARGACVSALNWAEILTRLIERGEPVDRAASRAFPASSSGRLLLVPFDEEQARETARIRLKTRSFGLSLADRAALALARIRRLPVLTSDRAWRSLSISVKIEVIR